MASRASGNSRISSVLGRPVAVAGVAVSDFGSQILTLFKEVEGFREIDTDGLSSPSG